MVYTLRFFFSSKCSLFHNSNLFGSCIIHILYTGVLKLKKIIPAPKRLRMSGAVHPSSMVWTETTSPTPLRSSHFCLRFSTSVSTSFRPLFSLRRPKPHTAPWLQYGALFLNLGALIPPTPRRFSFSLSVV